MNTCHSLSDRMPEVARGTSRWTAEEAAHLLGCAECAVEWRLMGSAMALGQRAADRAHVEDVAARVLDRLRVSPPLAAPRQPWIRRALLPFAAAAALVSTVWFGWPASAGPDEPATLFAVLPELDDLDESALESLVEVFTGPATAPIGPLDAAESLGDLSGSELESLLRLMEG